MKCTGEGVLLLTRRMRLADPDGHGQEGRPGRGRAAEQDDGGGDAIASRGLNRIGGTGVNRPLLLGECGAVGNESEVPAPELLKGR